MPWKIRDGIVRRKGVQYGCTPFHPYIAGTIEVAPTVPHSCQLAKPLETDCCGPQLLSSSPTCRGVPEPMPSHPAKPAVKPTAKPAATTAAKPCEASRSQRGFPRMPSEVRSLGDPIRPHGPLDLAGTLHLIGRQIISSHPSTSPMDRRSP